MLKAGKNINDFRFKCLRSVAPIENKRFDVAYKAVETDVTDYCDHVRLGYAHIAYCEGGRKEVNYVFDHVICVDIDKVDYDLQACYDKALYKPNFIHATPSDGKEGKHSFHLLYFFEDHLTKEEKRAHSQALREAFGADADVHLDQPVQVVGGMSVAQGGDLSTKQMFGCAYLYSKDTSLAAEQAEPVARMPVVQRREKKLWFENERYEGYFDEFHCHRFLADEGRLYPLVEWKINEKGERECRYKVRHDGEGRRRFLYSIGVCVRIFSKDTTYKEELEYNLRWWAKRNCTWGDGLDDAWIERAAERIMALDYSTLTLADIAMRNHHCLDMNAIRKENDKVSWQRCLAQRRYAETDPVILRLLKPHLHRTIAEMREIANDAGIDISVGALKALLKRNGKPHRAAKKLYQSQCAADEKKRSRNRRNEQKSSNLTNIDREHTISHLCTFSVPAVRETHTKCEN